MLTSDYPGINLNVAQVSCMPRAIYMTHETARLQYRGCNT